MKQNEGKEKRKFRWKKQFFCIAAGFLMYGLAEIGQAGQRISSDSLKRGGYGEDPVVYDLTVEGDWDAPLDLKVEIQPIQYEEEAAGELFDQIKDKLPEMIKGENESISEVRTDLDLPSDFSEYGIRISWRSENPDIIDSFGKIRMEDCPEEGSEAVLTAKLSHGSYEREEVFPIRVYPKVLTAGQRLSAALKKQIEEEDRRNPTEKEVKLPTEYEGHILNYQEKQDKDHTLFLMLGPLAAFLFYARERKEEEEKKKEREQKLLMDYADVVYDLMVFVGAGLTVGQAWERIVLNYKARLEGRRCRERPAYEEMAVALGQMQCGQAEGKAILDFGKRCQIRSYLKLTTLLEQNRRTGTKNLQQVLEQEMEAAWEQQKNAARRMGEEAGTKLLLPLFLMLFVVMVLVMVPAMMAMG